MSDFRPAFRLALTAKATPLKRRLTPDEILEVCQEVTEVVLAEAKQAWAKERKKANATPQAEQVYELFPKKVGRDEALRAINKALKSNTIEYLLDKTNQFAECVKSWPSSYRYFTDGGDRCPNPATWFNQGRYADDVREWKRHGARNAPPARPAAQATHTPTEAEEAQHRAFVAKYKDMPEPPKDTLEHALWQQYQTSDQFKADIICIATEQQLRHA